VPPSLGHVSYSGVVEALQVFQLPLPFRRKNFRDPHSLPVWLLKAPELQAF
jgi:hypothetical protein